MDARTSLLRSGFVFLFASASALAGCGPGGKGPGGENTGAPCTAPDACYPDAVVTDIQGTVTCLSNVPNGYCTHTCAVDTDCCAADGECLTDIHQVCAPLESAPQTYCLVACETSDVGNKAPDDYCHDLAGPTFTCRSTGGGSENRKVCLP